MSWEEQTRLFRELPGHLARTALFNVKTGCREQEVCSLRWEWEVEVPDLDTSVFIIPDALVKNGEERLVVLNRTAMSIVNDVRRKHRTFVFTYNGKRILKMNNTAWQKGRVKAGLPQVRVHHDKSRTATTAKGTSESGFAAGSCASRQIEDSHHFTVYRTLHKRKN